MKLEVSGFDAIEAQLEQLGGRDAARRIVYAGADKAIEVLKARTETAGHVVTGGMMASFAPGRYHEDIDKCWQDVYPQGYDSRGVDQAKKAFVINYGYGKRKTEKTGDKFITGKQPELKDAVGAAMQAEADRIREEIMR